jgi:gamma-glutamylcyclotransferase (GGCT)/AIG2-like uncharacterized protein YtfP
MYVFVYGTLRKGDSRFGVLDDSKCIAKVAHADGFEMLHLGGFPGIVPGNGRIVGEVYEIDEDTLARLDSIEGYREDDPKHSLYIRQEIDAYYEDGGTIPGPSGAGGEILTYVYNEDRSRGYKRDREVVESGDWFDVNPPRSRTA